MSSTAIPTTWADVTAEWMTDAISRVHPDAEVGDVHLLLEDDGTNRRARFGLETRRLCHFEFGFELPVTDLAEWFRQ